MNEQKKQGFAELPRLFGMPFAQGVALLYLILAGLWIFYSDWLVDVFAETQEQLRFFSTYKGWFFVVCTAAALFLILKRFVRKIEHARRQLYASEARFEAAADAGGVGIWDLDIATRQLFWDRRMFLLYGIEPQDSGNEYKDWTRCVHPDDLPAAEEAVRQAESGAQPLNTEFRIIRADTGEIRNIRASGKIVRIGDSQSPHMIGTNQDVTPRRKIEVALLERNRELERFNEASVGRELRMIELKQEVNALCRELGRPEPYPLGAVDSGKEGRS